MRRFLDKLFGRASEPADSPAVGEIHAFRTAPYSGFAAADTGRYAAFKVIHVEEVLVAVATLDGIWPAAPTLDQARRAGLLHEHRFSFDGRPAAFAVIRENWRPDEVFAETALLGRQPLSSEERKCAHAIRERAIGISHASLHFANYAAEGEWRWANDRAALVAESQARDAQQAAERAEREQRYDTRLKGLTFDQLLSEIPFENWTPSPPFPPEDFTRAARATLHDACRELAALGPKPRKPAVRAILKRTVEWFNAADEQAGGVIETEEREDICMALEEIAFAARQPALAAEIDAWREW